MSSRVALSALAGALCLAACSTPLTRVGPASDQALPAAASLAVDTASETIGAAVRAGEVTRPAVAPRVVRNGSRSARPAVALTFDLCATRDDPERLDLSIVRIEEGIRAWMCLNIVEVARVTSERDH